MQTLPACGSLRTRSRIRDDLSAPLPRVSWITDSGAMDLLAHRRAHSGAHTPSTAPSSPRPAVPRPPVSRPGLRLRIPAVALAGLLVLAGCSAGGGREDSSGSAAVPAVELGTGSADGAEVDTGSAGTSSADRAAAATQDGADVPAQVVVTGEATVRSADPVPALADLTETVADLGGSVASSTTDTQGDRPSAWATLRVPATRYQDLVDALPGLGTVLSSSTSTEDVGQYLADLDARSQALEASITRLSALIDQATSTADLLEAEGQLTSRQAELDSLNAQRAYLADQVAMSTLTVTLVGERAAEDPGASVWERSWQAFLGAVRGIGIGIVWALPWLVVLAVVLVPVVVVRRRRRRAAPPVPPRDGTAPEGSAAPSDTPSSPRPRPVPEPTPARGTDAGTDEETSRTRPE